MTDIVPAGDATSDGVPALGHLVAALSGDRADVESLTRVLTESLADAFPPGVVVVERERSFADRMAGRPGRPTGVSVALGDALLTLQTDPRTGTVAAVAKVVRGVTISRTPVSVTEWITALAERIRERATQDATARDALSRLLLG